MAINCEDVDHICVVGTPNELTAEQTDALRKTVADKLTQQKRFFVINMQGTVLIDSKGLETLLWVQEQSEQQLGQVYLCGLDESIRKVLYVTRLESRFDVFTDVMQAVTALR
jgi:anti-anti-sigma factor